MRSMEKVRACVSVYAHCEDALSTKVRMFSCVFHDTFIFVKMNFVRIR
jgi:hypothetical protein